MARLRVTGILLALYLVPCYLASGDSNPTNGAEEILLQILQKAQANEDLLEKVGFYHETEERKLSREGTIESSEMRTFRTTWIQDQPYMELLSINGKDLTDDEQKKEIKRREEFQKKMKKSKQEDDKDKEDFTWEELYSKYNFTRLEAEEGAEYVFVFEPRDEKRSERSRSEKVLNHLTGKFWADSDYNLLKVEARLLKPISFGLGVLARVNELEIHFSRQPFQNFWVPSSFFMKFDARLALLRKARVEVLGRFYDFFLRDSALAPS